MTQMTTRTTVPIALVLLGFIGCAPGDHSPTAGSGPRESAISAKGKPAKPTPTPFTPTFTTDMVVHAESDTTLEAACSRSPEADDSGDSVLSIANWREDTPCEGLPFWIGDYEILLVAP